VADEMGGGGGTEVGDGEGMGDDGTKEAR